MTQVQWSTIACDIFILVTRNLPFLAPPTPIPLCNCTLALALTSGGRVGGASPSSPSQPLHIFIIIARGSWVTGLELLYSQNTRKYSVIHFFFCLYQANHSYTSIAYGHQMYYGLTKIKENFNQDLIDSKIYSS